MNPKNQTTEPEKVKKKLEIDLMIICTHENKETFCFRGKKFYCCATCESRDQMWLERIGFNQVKKYKIFKE